MDPAPAPPAPDAAVPAAPRLARSCRALSADAHRSSMPSGTSSPERVTTASVNMCRPTLRTRITARPGSVSWPRPPRDRSQLMSPLSRRGLRPLPMSASRSPRMSPAKLLYTFALSSPSTAATLSSMSAITVTAASSITAYNPAGWVFPMACPRLMRSSMCSPLWRRSREETAEPARRNPTRCRGSRSTVRRFSAPVTACRLPLGSTAKATTSP